MKSCQIEIATSKSSTVDVALSHLCLVLMVLVKGGVYCLELNQLQDPFWVS